EVKKENLAKVVELLLDIMQHPTFPAIEFDIMKREARDGLQKFLTDPQMLAFRAIQRQLNPQPKGDVRYTPTVEEELALVEATTLDQVKDLYRKQLNGQAATLVVVGDFADLPATSQPIPQLEKLLANWKSD